MSTFWSRLGNISLSDEVQKRKRVRHWYIFCISLNFLIILFICFKLKHCFYQLCIQIWLTVIAFSFVKLQAFIMIWLNVWVFVIFLITCFFILLGTDSLILHSIWDSLDLSSYRLIRIAHFYLQISTCWGRVYKHKQQGGCAFDQLLNIWAGNWIVKTVFLQCSYSTREW